MIFADQLHLASRKTLRRCLTQDKKTLMSSGQEQLSLLKQCCEADIVLQDVVLTNNRYAEKCVNIHPFCTSERKTSEPKIPPVGCSRQTRIIAFRCTSRSVFFFFFGQESTALQNLGVSKLGTFIEKRLADSEPQKTTSPNNSSFGTDAIWCQVARTHSSSWLLKGLLWREQLNWLPGSLWIPSTTRKNISLEEVV